MAQVLRRGPGRGEIDKSRSPEPPPRVHMRIVLLCISGLLFPAGIFLAAAVSSAWEDYRNYTVEDVGIVSQRTATYAAVHLKRANLELPYALVSGTGLTAPPQNGPPFNLGDKVDVVYHPEGPAGARLKEALAPPSAPEWVRWLGFGLAGLALVLVVIIGSSLLMEFSVPSPRAQVGALFFVIVAGGVVGMLAFAPYFIAEHRRLVWWEGILLWLGDGTALFWFTVYFWRHFLRGVPIAAEAAAPHSTGRLFWLALVSILASMAADLSVTLWLRKTEWQAFANAQRTEGTIETLSKTKAKGYHYLHYVLRCRFVDARQQPYAAVFHINDPSGLPKLAPAAVQAIRMERLPAPITIAYDPDRPARCWLADLGWPEVGSSPFELFFFSLVVLPLQIVATVWFVGRLVQIRRWTGALPWWYDLHGVVLLAVEVGFAGGIGGLELFLEWLSGLVR